MGSGLKTVGPSGLNRAHHHLSGLRPCLLMSVLLRPTIGCYGQQYALTVRSGFGGGSYAAADSTFVLANPTPAGFVFDRWQITAALRDTFAMATRSRSARWTARPWPRRPSKCGPTGATAAPWPPIPTCRTSRPFWLCSRAGVLSRPALYLLHQAQVPQRPGIRPHSLLQPVRSVHRHGDDSGRLRSSGLAGLPQPHPELGDPGQRLDHAADR